MQSVYDNRQPVDDYLAVERAADRIVGPFESNELSSVHINRFRVIPKPNQSTKEASVNDGISKSLCSTTYSIDDAPTLEKILRLGEECLLAKVDVEHEYRNIPVHPADCLLAMR